MTRPRIANLERALTELYDAAAAVATGWSSSARSLITVGHERALLRLLGVSGVDAAGHPLAAQVVEQWLAGGTDRLGRGILLPFTAALREYELDPQALALEVAAGRIDLGLEAQLLAHADRRAAAEADATRRVASGLERIDANRVARRELIAALGDLPRPWVGVSIGASTAADAIDEARAAVRSGVDLVRVDVPAGRELAVRMEAAGMKVQRWSPPERSPAADALAVEVEPLIDVAPAGSQRGLGALRAAIDLAALERGGYVRIATRPPALSAPESAIVAAMERVDLVECDPVQEIVGMGLQPHRVLADHALARRLHRRSGVSILLGPGPLVVAPDLAAGVPGGAAARTGRALALQLVAALMAVADGLAPDRMMIGAIPGWLIDERHGFALAATEVVLRRMLLPDHPLAFAEPAESPRAAGWPYLLGAILPPAPTGALIHRRGTGDGYGATAAATRAMTAVAAELTRDRGWSALDDEGLAHARDSAASARQTVDALAGVGWGAVTHAQPGWAMLGGTTGGDPGLDSVAPRTDPFDPLGQLLASSAA